jgi:hypothetical protein
MRDVNYLPIERNDDAWSGRMSVFQEPINLPTRISVSGAARRHVYF